VNDSSFAQRPERIIPGAKNSQHNIGVFLSELVQYWTAIYPELADHQKVQLAFKPILPQGCDHIKEEVKMKFNFMKRMVIAHITGAALLLGTSGLAISQEQIPQHNAQRKEQQRNAQQQQRGTQQWRQEQERRQQRVQQQRLNQYSQQRRQLDRLAQEREKRLQQQRRQSHLRFQQQYLERLRQDQVALQNARSNEYSALSYRYSRGGRYYQTNQYGVDMLRQAVNYGYEGGVRAGQADREDRTRFSYRDSYAYQDASYGYNGYHVDLNEYRHYFREGFNRGYQDGYYSRSQYGRNSNGAFSLLGNILKQVFNAQPY
jgi:TolA-binding protein